MSNDNRGDLKIGEVHPSAHSAMDYVRGVLADYNQSAILQESLSSCAIEGNRLAEICSETLRRLLHNEPVSDRYLLGLAWFIKSFVDDDEVVTNG